MTECQHDIVTSTVQRGPYCCQCDAPLVGVFTPIRRDTPAGALLWAMKQAPKTIPSQGTKEQP